MTIAVMIVMTDVSMTLTWHMAHEQSLGVLLLMLLVLLGMLVMCLLLLHNLRRMQMLFRQIIKRLHLSQRVHARLDLAVVFGFRSRQKTLGRLGREVGERLCALGD